jgi:hypothetical protein
MRRLTAAFLATLAFAPQLLAQAPDRGEGKVRHHPEYVVQTAWLAAHLQSPRVVVLHVGHSDDSYRAGHIPGALFLPLSAVATW